MKAIWSLTALLLLAACGDKTDDGATPAKGTVTETVMDNVDDLQGTIGDDMIAVDDIRSQAPTMPEGGATGETGAAGAAGDDVGVSADGSPPADSEPTDPAEAE